MSDTKQDDLRPVCAGFTAGTVCRVDDADGTMQRRTSASAVAEPGLWFLTPGAARADYQMYKTQADSLAIITKNHVSALAKRGIGLSCYANPYHDIYGTKHYDDARLYVDITIKRGDYTFQYDITDMVDTHE